MLKTPTRPEDFTILIADDCENDILLYLRALKKGGVQNPVQVVRDGNEVIDYLSGHGQYADRQRFPMPRLLLLDIKMPTVNGFEVLEWMRSHDHFRRLPVIVVSASGLAVDINRAHDLGANAFLVKPRGFAELVKTMQTVTDFWCQVVEAPEVR